MNDLPTVQETLDKLAAHGSSQQIAEYLQAVGLVGEHESDRCPVARHIATTAVTSVYVTNFDWMELGGNRWQRLPGPVSDFVHDFDAGRYPRLEAET